MPQLLERWRDDVRHHRIRQDLSSRPAVPRRGGHGDADMLQKAFHDDARIFGSLADDRYDVTVSEFIDLRVSAPADTGSHQARILSVRHTGDAASVAMAEAGS